MATIARKPKLTEYEARQVSEIAAWKSAFPNPYGEVFRRVVQPLAWAVEAVVPDRLARTAVNAGYRCAQAAAAKADVRALAGVRELRELREKPLEFCDELARGVGGSAVGMATVEGLATGAGGVWTTLLDVPLLFTLCLRTIIKIGHCYGYPLDRPTDEAWVLGALAVALSCTPERRAGLLDRVHEIEELLVEETEEQVVVEEAAAIVTQIEIFESVPLFGAATGGLLNLSTAHRVDATARRLFQERWLRDNGRVERIQPLARADHPTSQFGWSGAFTRAAVGTVYAASFCATFPVQLASQAMAPAGGRRWAAAG